MDSNKVREIAFHEETEEVLEQLIEKYTKQGMKPVVTVFPKKELEYVKANRSPTLKALMSRAKEGEVRAIMENSGNYIIEVDKEYWNAYEHKCTFALYDANKMEKIDTRLYKITEDALIKPVQKRK